MALFQLLEKLPWGFGAFLIVFLFILFSVVGLLIVRKKVNLENLRSQHDVTGFIFGNIGVLYAVLLGFMVVNVQQRFDKIQENVMLEASFLAQIYRDAAVFPEKNRQDIQGAIKKYGDSVLNEEWPLMIEGIPSDSTKKALNVLWEAFYALEPVGIKQQAWYAESIHKLNKLMRVRLTRLIESQASIGVEMWTLLISGGVILVAFTWFFGLHSTTSHILMASVLAASIAFLLFLIYSLDTAFTGELSISRESLEKVMQSFEHL